MAETGAIPFVIGGDHALMYPDVAALADVYGKGKVGVVHFDAHYDAGRYGIGHNLTHGNPVRRLIEQGHVDGNNFIEIATTSWPKSSAMVVDPSYVTPLVANRCVREILTGIAMRKKGITEPHYLHPHALDDGQR